MKIKIGKNFDRDITQIIFLETEGMVRQVYNFYTEEAKTIKVGDPIEDGYILKIPNFLMPDLLKAMADLLEEEKIQTDSQAKREGELNATKYHLEDLRKFLKLK